MNPTKPQPLPTATPKAYVILRHRQYCTLCRSVHDSSTIMVHGELEARNGLGKPVMQLTALKGPLQYDLPIRVKALEPTQIPFCHECLEPHKATAHLPTPPQEDKRLLKPVGRFGVTLSESPLTGNPKERAPRRPKGPSADELLDMLD